MRRHPQRPALLLLLLATCALLGLVARPAAGAASDLRIRMASEATGPYHRQDMVEDASIAQSAMRITHPPELAGTLMFAQGPTSGQHFTVTAEQAAAGNFTVQFRVILPHSADDFYACTPYNVNHTANDEGDLFAGSIMITERRGGCAFAPKATTIQAAGAAAAAIHNCKDCADISELLRMTIPDNVDMPIMFWTDKDGFTIRSYLENRRRYFAWVRSNGTTTAPPAGDYELPVMAEVIGTGPIDPTEWSALKTIAATLKFTWQPTSDYSALRAWSDLIASPNLDPCLHRVLGLYCEAGHVVSIYLKYYDIIGTFDPAWGQLTKMRYFTLAENVPVTATGITGAVPEQICAWTGLLSIQIEGNTLKSLPECLGQLSQLQVLLVERNRIVALPPTLPPSLVWLMGSSNQLAVLPTMTGLVNIGEFGMSFNPLQHWNPNLLGPMIAGWTQVYTFNMFSCSLTGTLSADAFIGLKNLITLDLNNNKLSGALPALTNLTRLRNVVVRQNALTSAPTITLLPAVDTLDLSVNQIADSVPSLDGCTIANIVLNNNSFTGGIPPSWIDTGVKKIYLGFNQLSGPLNQLSKIKSVELIHLQNNLIVAPVNQQVSLAVGELLDAIASASLVELNINSNLIEGGWGSGQLNGKKLSKLSIVDNKLTSLPPDLFLLGGPLAALDVRNNVITGTLPTEASATLTSFLVEGNKLTLVDAEGELPTYVMFSDPPAFVTSSDKLYECHTLVGKKNSALNMAFDPAAVKFKGCRCAKGKFGKAPACDSVPIEASLSPSPHGPVASSAEHNASVALFADMLAEFDGDTNSFLSWENSTRFRLAPSFSDSWYGEDRLTVGLSTYWSIDLRTQRRGPDGTEHFDQAAVRAATVSPFHPFQPVRFMTVRLHISATHFTGITNQLVVAEGTKQDEGAVALQLLGSTWLNSSVANSSFTSHADYQARYGPQLARLSNPRLVEVVVLSSAASVYFSSRDSKDSHFIATYSYDYACPPGRELRASDDGKEFQCRLPRPPLEEYNLDVRYAVYAMAAVAIAFVLVQLACVALKWNSPIYRAASRPFVLLLLFLLTAMSAGSIQYALEPDPTGADANSGVCLGRAWLTALPLAGILAVLLAKTHRLYRIFCSTKIQKVTNATDLDLMRTVGIICLLEVALLVVFSVLQLSKAEFDTLGLVQTADGVVPRYLVVQCSMEDGFVPWMAAQLALFFVMMLTSTALAIKTRGIPDAFNESTFILNTCYLLLFFCIILVPLDWILLDKPEVGVLLQGFGQAFLAFTLTVILLAPKMYIALSYSDRDQMAMTQENTQMGSNMTTRGSITSGASSMGGGGSSGGGGGGARGSVVSPSSRASITTPAKAVTPAQAKLNAAARASGANASATNLGATADTPKSNVPKFSAARPSLAGGATPAAGAKAMPLTRAPSFAAKPLGSANGTNGGTAGATPTNPSASPKADPSPVGTPAVSPMLSTPGGSNGYGGGAMPPLVELASLGPSAAASPSPSPSPSALSPSSPSGAPRAHPTFAIHFRVAPSSPSMGAHAAGSGPPGLSRPGSLGGGGGGGGGGATPGLYRAASSSAMGGDSTGDSALEFVKRLRSRIPANANGASNGGSAVGSPPGSPAPQMSSPYAAQR